MKGRKNAMLTTEDRRWLTGEKTYEGEYAKQQRYQRRRDIRDRVYNSVLDFSILFDHLEPGECEKLFDAATDEADPAFIAGLRDALAFILYHTGIAEALENTKPEPQPQPLPLALVLLADALGRAGVREDILVEDVALEVEATRLPLSGVLADLEAGRAVSPAGLRLVLESDLVDTERVQACIRELVFDDE